MNIRRWHLFLLLFALLLPVARIPAQQKFEYLSPLPNSVFVSRFTNIIIREGEILTVTSGNISDAVNVVGKQSGIHKGRTTLASDGKTIIFVPDTPFVAGEEVEVSAGNSIKTRSGGAIGPLSYEFSVSQLNASPSINFMDQLRNEVGASQSVAVPEIQRGIASQPSPNVRLLPPDFPAISVSTTGVTSPGDIFLSNFRFDAGANTPYLMIVNNAGEPLYYKEMPGICLDFKIQPTGQLTYFDGAAGVFNVMDNAFNILGSYATGNGYVTDLHEFRLMPNGHGFLLANDPEPVRMDTVVAGGNPNASVVGLIVQEVDENKNVVFQWRSWDHYAITDSYADLTTSSVDYVHGNALEVDYDGNLLLSSRHLSEITKINIQTGAIIWRLGGKNNQFTFINDTTKFSFQHAIRRLENGDIVVFDNGNARVPPYSRAVEYRLDENAKTATLVWQYRNSPDNDSFAMGYVQRLPDTNTLIGWGASNPSVTEVTPTGTKAFEMTLPPGVFSYRAYRIPWKDGVLAVGLDTLNFGNVSYLSGSVKQISVTNLTNVDQSVTSFATRDSEFTVLTSVPIDIPARDSVVVSVRFQPSRFGIVTDILDIRSETGTQGIIEQIPLNGMSTPPTMQTSAAELDFGNVPRGLVGTQAIRIRNTSPNSLIVDSMYTRNGLFRVSPTRIAIVDTGLLLVTFTPNVEGSFTDILYIQNNSTTPLVQTLLFASSHGMPITDEERVNFGPEPIQDTAVAAVWIHDTLASSITIVGAVGTNNVFAPEAQFPIDLLGHDSSKVNLRFNPQEFGQYIDTLLFESDSLDVAVLASGISPPPVLATGNQLMNFGSIRSDSTAINSIQVHDSSINTVRIDSVFTSSKVFSINPLKMPMFLGKSDSLKIDIRFSPSSPGSYSDTLTILNNSPNGVNKIALVGIGSSLTLAEGNDLVPKTYVLGQNYPNPFNPSTMIPFGVPSRSSVRIEVYNILGQSVAKLVDRQFEPGYYNVFWDGHAPSGVYLYTMQAVPSDNSKSDILRVMKMLLLK